MSSLHHRYDEFVERDFFLHLLLGLVSATDRAGRLVSQDGRAQGAPADADDEPLLFLLGVVAVTQRLRSSLENARTQGQTRLSARRSASDVGQDGWIAGSLR
jgi:hypothetical protein